jgi:hypothetical protein
MFGLLRWLSGEEAKEPSVNRPKYQVGRFRGEDSRDACTSKTIKCLSKKCPNEARDINDGNWESVAGLT